MKASIKSLSFYLCIGLVILLLAGCSGVTPSETSSESVSLPTVTKIPDTLTPAPSPTITSTPEPSPIPTLPPPPVAVLVPRLYTIDITQNNEAPIDLQEYVFDYSSGAGGGMFCEAGGTTAWETSYAGAIMPAVPQRMYWVVENVPDTPEPTAILKLPDGSEATREATARGGCSRFSYEILPGTLLGDYSIEFLQGNTSLVDTFSLQMPADPVRVVYEGIEWFAGFEPDEQVTLNLYYLGTLHEFLQPEIAPLFPALPDFSDFFVSGELEIFTLNAFLGTQMVMADEYGAFQVQYTSELLPLTDENYMLDIGDGTRITTVAEGEMSGLTSVNKLSGSCYASLPSRLEVGDTAVVTEYVEQNDLYTVHSWVTLEPGTLVTMVMGPFCPTRYEGPVSDQWIWFIDAPEHPAIQVSECDSEGYFLEPVEP